MNEGGPSLDLRVCYGEIGRSMVEMLGTLALIGVLSVVGLMGYSYLMDGIKANSILNEVNKRAHTCVTQFGFMDREECDLSEYNEQIDGKYTTSPFNMNNGYFGIQVADVPKSICQQVLNKGFHAASQILPETCGTLNEMKFVFDKELSGGLTDIPQSCSDTSECGDCEQCGASGFCETTCTNGAQCAGSFDVPTRAKSCCPPEKLVDGVCCAYPDGNGKCCDGNGANCCPPDKPIMGRNGTTCYACDQNVAIEVDERTQKCSRCTNRKYSSAGYGYIGWCKPLTCPEDKPLMSYTGICYICGTTVAQRNTTNWRGDTSTCSQCEENSLANQYCLVCPDSSHMLVQNGKCTCENGYMIGYSNNTTPNNSSSVPVCYSCGSENLNGIAFHSYNTSVSCSSICSNRITVNPQTNYYKYCALASCPSGYMHDRYGHCKACTSNQIQVKPSSLTNSCSECNGKMYTSGDYCKKCPTDIFSLSESQQIECSAGNS